MKKIHQFGDSWTEGIGGNIEEENMYEILFDCENFHTILNLVLN